MKRFLVHFLKFSAFFCVVACGYEVFKGEAGNAGFWLALACVIAISFLFDEVQEIGKKNGIAIGGIIKKIGEIEDEYYGDSK